MSATRATILQVLRDDAELLTIAQVAERAGVHPNTVRFHLDSLLASGQVEQVRATPDGPGRPTILVRAVAAMDRSGPQHAETLAQLLLADIESRPHPQEHAREAGRRWGRRIAERVYADGAAPVTGLVDALDELEFAPERSKSTQSSTRIGLHHCPFLDFTTPTGGLVCAIHLGLMQGVLDGSDSAIRVERLDPFVRPDLCCAHLSSAS
ncbi:transcriptional regulator [Flexivirga endophytica]|uniref:Transcriptional regulator n=1 Tax=Flexivirga endophytica TaxID=1849103 RepID=A0A916SUJ4_9MICO|nr:helix-turn-helix domain-containing protein [Flexivirga endophytica]GGB14441.1 transcriptional regulator [Flexivirga endophytica]GHB65846.1 transcriptional regulator [Flexivirga endophytica]